MRYLSFSIEILKKISSVLDGSLAGQFAGSKTRSIMEEGPGITLLGPKAQDQEDRLLAGKVGDLLKRGEQGILKKAGELSMRTHEIASHMKAVQKEMPTTVRLSEYLRKDVEPENVT
ncbi:hypothetical protein ACFX2J_028163 [Malus domestica]